MRREMLLLALIIVFLVGCARTKEYVAIESEPYDLENAKVICRNATESKARMVTQFGGTSTGFIVTDIISAFLILADASIAHNSKQAFNECMKSKGWTEK